MRAIIKYILYIYERMNDNNISTQMTITFNNIPNPNPTHGGSRALFIYRASISINLTALPYRTTFLARRATHTAVQEECSLIHTLLL